MHFLPHFPIHFNPIVLFGLTLLLGLLGGEIAKATRLLPRISGYIAVGFLVGPNGFNIATPSALADASFFVDIALGLILFDLGRHLDFSWLRHDRGLLPMAITESCFTFSLVFAILHLFKFPWLPSALAATIATATSPAVVMMVAHDISSEGPITRRTMMLTSLNNLFSLILFTILLPVTHVKSSTPQIISEHITYRLLGSVILGLIIFIITICLSRLTGKNKESQFILFVGAVALGIGLAISLNLSTMLTLFTFGVAARNLDRNHRLTEVAFGWLARLFFVLLFVVTGVYLKFQGLWQATWIVLAFLFVKILAKMIGVLIFSGASRLTKQQALALGFTLAPMAELAIGMSNRLVYFNPNFSHQLLTIITAAVAILYILGPIAVQIAFIKTGEATVESR
ncbi:MAG: hypothetical protein A3F42_00860 [Gammaproteobacteria bacterium RIFCSPHIGHO2_12_FULL_37_34]|nr:MAG: hypothetical protein A3F42_00860 [Gammaproteobacteria bacterium RIFCSPHIGHO2_12_FULL_37_34]